MFTKKNFNGNISRILVKRVQGMNPFDWYQFKKLIKSIIRANLFVFIFYELRAC